eukprot:4057293-Prymnesium_polylepis.1
MAPRPRWKRSPAGMRPRRRHLGGVGASASSPLASGSGSPGTRAGRALSARAAGAIGAAGSAGTAGVGGGCDSA